MALTKDRRICGLILAALAALTTGCDITSPTDKWDRLEREMVRNRARWEQQGIQSYSYVMSQICECIPYFEGPSRVSVEAGVITEVRRIGNGGLVAENLWSWWRTMEGLFNFVASSIEEPAAFLEVEYDPARGFPTRIEVDMWEQTVDDEKLMWVSDFSSTGL